MPDEKTSELLDLAAALSGALLAVDAEDLSRQEMVRLLGVRKRIGWLIMKGAEQEARRAVRLPDPATRSSVARAIRAAFHGRPWRTKVAADGRGGWSASAKAYTDHGTVIVYARDLENLVALTDRLDPAVAAVRRSPEEILTDERVPDGSYGGAR